MVIVVPLPRIKLDTSIFYILNVMVILPCLTSVEYTGKYNL